MYKGIIYNFIDFYNEINVDWLLWKLNACMRNPCVRVIVLCEFILFVGKLHVGIHVMNNT